MRIEYTVHMENLGAAHSSPNLSGILPVLTEPPSRNLFKTYSNGELFPVVDHVTGSCIGYKEREAVHADGDFHMGVQAFIVRENRVGNIEVLIQKRSSSVDISKGRHDQSLATQLLAKDGGDLIAALKRGLREELDIQQEEIELASVGASAELRIYKKYEEDPLLYNREFISLYFVKVRRREIHSSNPKVAGLEWMEWGTFVERVKENPADFAKTCRFYVMNAWMLEETERALKDFVRGERTPGVFTMKKCY
jgi:isopentenyldiphosphate isomerase